MSTYVFLFRTTPENAQAAMGTPEAAQRSLQAWLAWMREMEESGNLKDPGQPLDRSGRVVSAGSVTDGPYLEAKDMVMGFMLVEAADLAEAERLAARCPMVLGGGTVEIRPVRAIEMPPRR